MYLKNFSPAHWCNAFCLFLSQPVRWLSMGELRLSRQNVIRYTFLCPAVCGSFSHSLNNTKPPFPFPKKQHSSNQDFGFSCVPFISFRYYQAKAWGPRKVLFVVGAGFGLSSVTFLFFFYCCLFQRSAFPPSWPFMSHTTVYCR